MVITTDKDKLTRPLNFILKKARTPSADGRKQVGICLFYDILYRVRHTVCQEDACQFFHISQYFTKLNSR